MVEIYPIQIMQMIPMAGVVVTVVVDPVEPFDYLPIILLIMACSR